MKASRDSALPVRAARAFESIEETSSGTAASSVPALSLVWAAADAPALTLLARGSLDSSAGDMPLRNGDRLILFGSSGAVCYAAVSGGLHAVARSDESRALTPLGLDADRIYAAVRPPVSELVVLHARNGSVIVRTTLADSVQTAIGVGDRLLLSGNHSVSLVEPACGPAPDAGLTNLADAAAETVEQRRCRCPVRSGRPLP